MQPPGAKWLAPESDALDDLSLIRKVAFRFFCLSFFKGTGKETFFLLC